MYTANRIYGVIAQKHYKQSAIARCAGYDAKLFNAMLKGRKKIYADDIPAICEAICVSPNELFNWKLSDATSG